MLAATRAELAERRDVIRRIPALTRLRDRLRLQVQPLLDQPLYLPTEKALLSRDGGVCPDDGSRLSFSPFSPHRHQCPKCGQAFAGDRHHRAWITKYQIWLTERAIHLALLAVLNDEPALATRAIAILQEYAERYRSYPNRDNVLGPTRPFFSTYLESIWLVQVAIAAALLDTQNAAWPERSRTAVRSMVEESAALIASFDEGWSNRQAWNNAALVGAGRWLNDGKLVDLGLGGSHGLRAQLATAVSADGLWFEGENYHFFALRGLALGVEVLRRDGIDLYHDSVTGPVLAAMYSAPLKTLLPDLTLPARSDSPYGVSVLQPRFAELWEIGRARTKDGALEAFLADLYATPIADGPDFGMFELAEQEQNRVPQRLSRDRLGWKALLWMLVDEPSAERGSWQPGSVLLADHGLAILRERGRYLSIECGGRPGGHGHPDLLHVTLYASRPWLVDPGTGSYVSSSLHWYRSTLAHNAPGVSGGDQFSRLGQCTAFANAPPLGMVRAEAREVFGPRTSAARTLISGPDWTLDVIDINVPPDVSVDLPIHVLGDIVLPRRAEREQTPERELNGSEIRGLGSAVGFRSGNAEFFVALPRRENERVLVCKAPGPPDLLFADGPAMEFLVRRASGAGRWVQAYATVPVEVVVDGEVFRIVCDARTDQVQLRGLKAQVRVAGAGAGAVLLESSPGAGTADVTPGAFAVRPTLRVVQGSPGASGTVLKLGAAHYRRSEEPYDPTRFQAEVTLMAEGRRLGFYVRVVKPEVVFWRPEDPDPGLDNENPDIHSDGVLLYFDADGWTGFSLVPGPSPGQVYIRSVTVGKTDPKRLEASWRLTENGYDMTIWFDMGKTLQRGDRFPLNLVVNEMTSGRQRRLGQLVLSGDSGWVYLRGDRESPDTAVVLEIE